MEKHIRQIAGLLLAGLIAVLAPAQAWAAETDEKEMEMEPGGVQESQPSDEAQPFDENQAEVRTDEIEVENKTDALNEPGEVTEPTTKEDKPYLAPGGKPFAGSAGSGVTASWHQPRGAFGV